MGAPMIDNPVEWIASWVTERRREPGLEINQDTDLYRSGLLDSLGIIELVEAVEDHFDMMFTDEEMQAGLTTVADFQRALSART